MQLTCRTSASYHSCVWRTCRISYLPRRSYSRIYQSHGRIAVSMNLGDYNRMLKIYVFTFYPKYKKNIFLDLVGRLLGRGADIIWLLVYSAEQEVYM